jgi:hypothetical protein
MKEHCSKKLSLNNLGLTPLFQILTAKLAGKNYFCKQSETFNLNKLQKDYFLAELLHGTTFFAKTKKMLYFAAFL